MQLSSHICVEIKTLTPIIFWVCTKKLLMLMTELELSQMNNCDLGYIYSILVAHILARDYSAITRVIGVKLFD